MIRYETIWQPGEYIEKLEIPENRSRFHDDGMTWDKTVYMLGWWRYRGGFTSTRILRDGRVVTADTGWASGDNDNRIEVTILNPLSAR